MDVSTFSDTYICGGKTFDLYGAVPKSGDAKTLAGVLIAPAWDGLNAPIEEIARKVAALGYVAVAVDVYGQGVRGDMTADNSALMNPLVENRAELHARLLAAYTAIQAMDSVDEKRLGAMGYCFGGLCVLDLARINAPQLKSVVSFHGVLGSPDNLQQSDGDAIKASILIEHGWDDPVAPPEDFMAFTREMNARKADWQAHAHGGAVHAFTFDGANSPETGVAYDEAADRRSWESMAAFFAETLV